MSDDTLTRESRGDRDAAPPDVDSVFPRPSPWMDWTVRSVFARTLAERLTLALLAGLGLLLMAVWMGPLFNSLEDSLVDMSESLGDGVLSVFGDFATPSGWLNAEIYSLFAPAVLVFVALSSAAMAFAEDQEDHHIGLLAANPIGRSRMAVDKAAAVFSHTWIVAVLTGVGTWVGVQLGSLGIPASRVAAMTLHFALFGTVVGATGMLLAVMIGRKVPAMVGTAGVVLVVYAWGSFAPQSDALEPFAVLSPWDWYFGPDPLTNGVSWGDVALLVAATALLCAAAVRRFARRDLAG